MESMQLLGATLADPRSWQPPCSWTPEQQQVEREQEAKLVLKYGSQVLLTHKRHPLVKPDAKRYFDSGEWMMSEHGLVPGDGLPLHSQEALPKAYLVR